MFSKTCGVEPCKIDFVPVSIEPALENVPAAETMQSTEPLWLAQQPSFAPCPVVIELVLCHGARCTYAMHEYIVNVNIKLDVSQTTPWRKNYTAHM